MGRVYLGFSPAGRAVAVKVIRPELARDQGFVGRFRREVAAARQVNGLYTATVVDSGEEAPWLATAFVPGPSLAEAVEVRGPLAEDPVWRLAGGLVEALAAVHACGLVHRDLKPANVLLATDGPRLIDFGISLALEGTALTGTGLAVGTPGFMSPEQADGERAGSASDVFSLGSVLTYAATGIGPFGDGQAAAVIYRIVHNQPALDGLPGPLRGLIAGCLARDPSRRPTLDALMDTIAAQRAADLAGSAVSFWPPALTEFIASYQASLAIPPSGLPDEAAHADGAPTHASGAPAPVREPTGAAATGHPPHVSQRTVAPHHPSPSPPPQSDRAPASLPAPVNPARRRRRRRFVLVLVVGALCAAAVTTAVLAGQRAPHHSVHSSGTRTAIRLVRTLSDPGFRGVRAATHVTAVAFSPDGKTLATGYAPAAVSGIPGYTGLWDTATGHRAATLTDLVSQGVTAMAFSRDGKILATGDYNGSTDLWDTATERRTATTSDRFSDGVTAVAFSPDGRTLAVGNVNSGTDLRSTATGHRTAAFGRRFSYGVTAVAFSPDGKTLVIGVINGYTHVWDIATKHRTAAFIGPASLGVTAVAFSPDGKTVATGDGNGRTYLWDTGTWQRTATFTDPESKGVTAVAFSPDGKILAVGDENGSTYVWDVATGRRTATLTDPGSKGVTAVAFSPDGKTLATGDYNISTYLWGIDGGAPAAVVPSPP